MVLMTNARIIEIIDNENLLHEIIHRYLNDKSLTKIELQSLLYWIETEDINIRHLRDNFEYVGDEQK